MAQNLVKRAPGDLSPTRYSEQRTPQFVGGDVDAVTGNLVPAGTGKLAAGDTPTPSAPAVTPNPAGGSTYTDAPMPTQPTTRLATIDAVNQPPAYTPPAYTPPIYQPQQSSGSSFSSSLASAAGQLGSALLGKGLQLGDRKGSNSGSNPLDGPQGGNQGFAASDSSTNSSGGTSRGGGPLSPPPDSTDVPLPTPRPDIPSNGPGELNDAVVPTNPSGSPDELPLNPSAPDAPVPPPEWNPSAPDAPGPQPSYDPPPEYTPAPSYDPSPAPYVPPPELYNPPTPSYDYSDSEGSSGGNWVICAFFADKGELDQKRYRTGLVWSLRNMSPQTIRGYHAWAVPTVRAMQRGSYVGRALQWFWRPVVRHRAIELGYLMGTEPKGDFIGKITRYTFEPFSWCVGYFVGEQDWQSLWAKPAKA